MKPTDDFDEFAATRWPALVRAGWLLTGDWHRAEDLAQATLAKTWRHWGRVTAADDPDRYVRRILSNEFLRSRHRWRRHEAHEAITDGDVGLGPAFDDTVADRGALAQGLRQLPPGQRLVLVLRYYLDMSERDVAETLACSVGNVKSQAARGLTRLRAVYRDGVDAAAMKES